MKINQLYEANALNKIPACPLECLVIISNTPGLSFALERIGPLATIIITVFYLLVLYLSALSNTPEKPFASIYSDFLIKTACQRLLLLVGFDTLIYRKYYDTPPILVGHLRKCLFSKIWAESTIKWAASGFWGGVWGGAVGKPPPPIRKLT
jgi:hypothetical protein